MQKSIPNTMESRTFATTFLILLRGVFSEGGREGEGRWGWREREGRDFIVPNVFLSNSQWVLNMFYKFSMRSPTCSQIASHFI